MSFPRVVSRTLALLFSVSTCTIAAAQEPPALHVTLKPHATGGADSYMGVAETFVNPRLAAGQGLLHLPIKLVGVNFPRYDGDAITARDDAGALPLDLVDEPPTPQGIYHVWKVKRATVGDVVVSYHAQPRVVDARTNNGPLFDLREEGGGFIGSGLGFLAAPAVKEGTKYHVQLHWDLSDAPAGSAGAWSLGDGDVDTVLSSEDIAYSFYAVGPMHRYPEAKVDKYAQYWFGDPPFSPQELGEGIQNLYAYMSKFFGAADPTYRVFIRRNPYSWPGGTALIHSFMFGYKPEDKPTVASLQWIMAHEMVHNWPLMDGDGGEIAWYNEGVAEYYSMLLSHRAGVLNTGQFLASLNEKTHNYYTNPYVSYGYADATRQFWIDRMAQKVPYGRGLLYMIQTDAAIRAASHGKHSLDDIVLELYRRRTHDEPHGAAQWLDLVGREIGTDTARRDYDAMLADKVLAASPTRFAPCIRPVPYTVHTFQLGFGSASLNEERTVRDLVPGSAAERAGVRNGDVIVSSTDVTRLHADEKLPMELTLRRDGKDIRLSYLPRGPALTAYKWVRNPHAPESSCKF